MRRYRIRLLAGMIVILLAATTNGGRIGNRLGAEAASAQEASAVVRQTPAAGNTSFAVGVTHTEHSADAYGNPAAVASAKSLLAARPILQNQHIMGWGAGNPEPSPGQFDWSTLDARVKLIESTHGVPVITLCCAPDWMKGGVPGHTNWADLAIAPMPDHYADFADLARRVALRYPEVHYFQVWNELKGLWNTTLNRWNYEGYTALYNDVYDALKSVNASIQVGGPYVVMSSTSSTTGTVSGPWGSVDPRALAVVTYWLAHKHGADFVAVDGGSATQQGRMLTDEYTATQKFAAIDRWLRTQTSLPIWWSELYVQQPGVTWTPRHQAAAFSSALANLIGSGASVALLWSPQADAATQLPYLWTDTRKAGGGQPSPLYWLFSSIAADFPSPAAAAQTTTSVSRLVAGGTQRYAVVVNGTGQTLDVSTPASQLQMLPEDVVIAGT